MTLYDPEVGWVALTQLLSADEVTEIRSVCAELLALPATQRQVGDKPVAGTHHLVSLHTRSEAIAALTSRRPELTSLITRILGPNHHIDQCGYRSPQPGHGGQSLHTDDIPRSAIGPDTVATAIVALTDFTATNGATRLVPGSHRRIDLQRHAGSLQRHPDELLLTGPAGTAFGFSGHVLHSGTKNISAEERPALQIIWRVGRKAPTG